MTFATCSGTRSIVEHHVEYLAGGNDEEDGGRDDSCLDEAVVAILQRERPM
jgi:hypothetical protein